MKNYIVIVRDFNPCCNQPSDEHLKALDMYYESPVVALDWESDRDKAMDEFDEKYGNHFSHFLHHNYQLIPV
jgi:hypothetical protein